MNQSFTLANRIALYNNAGFPPPPLTLSNFAGRPFFYGTWFTGGGRHDTGFYGSYHTEYLRRVESLFPDCKGTREVLHLFSGALPSGPYTRVGIDPTGLGKSADIIGNAEQLSSFLPFNPSLVYADPPYSVEDCDHYQIGMLNRARVLDEIGLVLKPGGMVVWLDQALPVFSNNRLNLVGIVSYIRSTGNRFRCVSFFQKPYVATTTSPK